MPINDSTPTEQMPQDYDGEVMTRAVEDIYKRLHKVSRESSAGIIDLMGAMNNIQGRLDNVEDSAGGPDDGQTAMLPLPVDLDAFKVPFLPIVLAWCKPIDVTKYPNVAGFQFFSSVVHNFIPTVESALISLNGTAYSTHATDLVVCATASTLWFKGTADTNLQFFASMSPGNTKVIKNLTTGSSGVTVNWTEATPKTLVTDVAWNAGDAYQFDTWVPGNLVGQGPLPFAMFFMPDWLGNPGWDGETVYVKARTYSLGSKSFSNFQCASTTGNDGETLPAPTINASPVFWLGNIDVWWTMGVTWKDYHDELDHYDVYRTTANSTALLTQSAIIYSGKGFIHVDLGYNVTSAPNGPIQGKQYWYWVVCINLQGQRGTFSAPNAATLDVGGVVTIYEGSEQDTTSFFNMKTWNIKWYDTGDSEAYWVRCRRDYGGAVYGWWTLPVFVWGTTEYGLHGSGYYIQQFAFLAMEVGVDYQFAVQATNNGFVPDLAGAWDTETYTITDSLAPDAPA